MNRTVLVTGASGFLATHLGARLVGLGARVVPVHRDATTGELADLLGSADTVAHLAGVTQTPDPREFDTGNRGTTAKLASAIEAAGAAIPVVYASSIRAASDTPYGISKRAAEGMLLDLNARTGSPVAIFRLPSFFGKWSRPNYNSAVATFCHQAATGRRVQARTPEAPLQLVTLDAVVDAFVAVIGDPPAGAVFPSVEPVYDTSVGQVARLIEQIARAEPTDAGVSSGLVEGLQLTYRAHAERVTASV